MTINEFRNLFLSALDEAATSAEKKLGKQIPRSFLVELHGAGCSGQRIAFDDAIARLYLGSNRFYKIIDIAIISVLPGTSVAFVRVSGHTPVEFQKTWNALELGPFKQMEPIKIDDHRASGQ